LIRKPRRRPLRRGALALQASAILLPLGLTAWLFHNAASNLADRGIAGGYDFLDRAARFPLSEHLLPYDSLDSFGWALLVGLSNTLFLSLIVIALGTALGLILGLARRSRHPLSRGVSTVFLELLRNTPVVTQLLFWYAILTFTLPSLGNIPDAPTGLYLTNRGFYLPRLSWPYNGVPLLALLAGLLMFWACRPRRARIPAQAAIFSLIAMLFLYALSPLGPTLDMPVRGRFNLMGGVLITPEFAAAVLGFTLYGAAFIGEIVRSGIDAVPRGQLEAGKALGMSEPAILRRILLPQALRTIIPPLTSQYVTMIKNSTVALVVGYPELNFVTATTINQTGQAIEVILILILAFLAMSGITSFVMGRVNRRVALVER
jgi:general L-amino acid transport system permease protein